MTDLRFTAEKLAGRIAEVGRHRYRDRRPVPGLRLRAAEPHGRPGAVPDDDPGWRPWGPGERWPERRAAYWLRGVADVPRAWAGKAVCLLARIADSPDLGAPEALLFVDGVPFQGIDHYHEEALLAERAGGGESYRLDLYVYTGARDAPEWLRFVDLAELVRPTERFYFRAWTLLRAACEMDETWLVRHRWLRELDRLMAGLDLRRPGSDAFHASVEHALAGLDALLAGSGRPPRPERVKAIGHAHIDLAWLWPWSVTRTKAARTFATVLRYMEQYPEFRYIQTQIPLYRAVRDEWPELYARVRERVRAGQWEAEGGMYVEPDCNLPGGESLARQLLYGQRAFEREFGRRCALLWLPDAFGYSAALPQLMRAAGIKYFMTTKISWNQYNQLPHDSFYWEGIDGTRVLAHFCTTPTEHWFKTYNAELSPRSVLATWNAYKQNDVSDAALMSFGWGDGGGGPSKEFLETARALQGMPDFPQLELDTAASFFRELARVPAAELPVWRGELYLEYHRGTYTSQAAIKQANRQAEALLRDAEWLSCLAAAGGAPYPAAELEAAWERVLFNQFHDILPGSSVAEVYVDAAADHARVRAALEPIVEGAMAHVAGGIAARHPGWLLFNGLGWERGGLVELPASEGRPAAYRDAAGAPLPAQPVGRGSGPGAVLVEAPRVPPLGYAPVYAALGAAAAARAAAAGMEVTPGRLENEFFRIELNDRGEIARLLDKRATREVVREDEPANMLQAFEDRPLAHEAWDIDIFYQTRLLETASLAGPVEVEERGPLRGTLRLVRRVLGARIEQRVRIYRGLPRIDFDTTVDWDERQVLLKAAFPVEVHADRATYEIQFGNVERPTHWNTSWDWARFEAAAHKWVDLSEAGYGVALLNDGKYGHDVRDHTLRLTLLRGPIHPDPDADRGRHAFRYALWPHPGGWREGGVVRAAYELNLPLRMTPLAPRREPGGEPVVNSHLRLESADVVVECVKRAESGRGLVLRMYEAHNRRGAAILHCHRPVRAAWECSLLEDEERPLPVDGGAVLLRFLPYEIKTLKLEIDV